MLHPFSRSELLLGAEAIERLKKSRVAVFGIGGVGGYAVEALARAGVGQLDLVDNDAICLTNLNRQIIATYDTIGKAKVDVMKERVHAIHPDCRVTAHRLFFLPETKDRFDFAAFDYVIDAIDTVAGKLALIEACKAEGTPIICAMGAGNKVDPTAYRVADISKTTVDPLARAIRTACKKRGIQKVKVVFSTEPPLAAASEQAALDAAGEGNASQRRSLPGSVSFVPPVVGMILAGEVIKDLIGFDRNGRNGTRGDGQ